MKPGAVSAALLAASLAAGCGGSAELRPLAPGTTVLAFGDSLTYGTGASPAQSYPARLAELTGLNVLNAGVPGETSAEGLERLPAALEETRPALVLLCHGANDMLQKLDRARAVENLKAMAGLARAAGADVVLVGVPEPAILLKTAGFYRRAASEAGAPLEEKAFAAVLSDGRLKSDYIHPNAAGYGKVAERVHEFLKEKGAL